MSNCKSEQHTKGCNKCDKKSIEDVEEKDQPGKNLCPHEAKRGKMIVVGKYALYLPHHIIL